LIEAPNSSGVFTTELSPIAISPSSTSGSATILATSRWSRSTISFDVPAGTRRPAMNSDSWFGTPESWYTEGP